MNSRIETYKNYTIVTEDGVEKGIFFRSPIQAVDYTTYPEEIRFSAWDYMHKIKNPFRRLYERLLGNGEVVKHIEEWSQDTAFGGFEGKILCSPFYFRREYRKLRAICNDVSSIQEINSYGYESEFNICSGECKVEKTKIQLLNGKKIRLKSNKAYHYTYEHIVKEIIDTGGNCRITVDD